MMLDRPDPESACHRKACANIKIIMKRELRFEPQLQIFLHYIKDKCGPTRNGKQTQTGK